MASVVLSVLAVLTAGSLLVWLGSLVRLMRTDRPPLTVLPDDVASAPDETQLVSVVLPARDEEANIRACLTSLLAQDYPRMEIVVVDDRSSDRTASIVREIAAADGRVRLERVDCLPDGWYGKTHALHVGVQRARGRWLLFTDADCRHDPNSVRSGLAFLQTHGGQMLTLTPGFQTPGLIEKIVQPAVSTNFAVWFIFGSKDPFCARRPFANGQYMLIRRDAYDAVGGMASVRNRITEDVAFARACHAAGLRVLTAVGTQLFSTRMYDSLAAMWHGWTRIYYGAFETPGMLVAVWLRTFVVAFLPFPVLVGSAAAVVCGGAGGGMTLLAALSLATVIASMMTSRRSYPLMGMPSRYAPAYPLGVFAALCFQVGALSRAAGLSGVTWRGTRYRGGQAEEVES
ncbi:MAG: glycosyltransferase [Planctomycetes bacterium]|nr:glycosyltransferase [Planctomycetota bacterium]